LIPQEIFTFILWYYNCSKKPCDFVKRLYFAWKRWLLTSG